MSYTNHPAAGTDLARHDQIQSRAAGAASDLFQTHLCAFGGER